MPDYTWNPQIRRYVDAKGKVVTPAQQRKIGLAVVAKSADLLDEITQDYIDGVISVEEWALAMRFNVKAMHSAMVQIAFGGKESMGPVQRGFLGSVIRKQFEHLLNFAFGVQSGKVKTDEALKGRARMYGEAGWSSYEGALAKREKLAGMQEEHSFLEPDADHCEECFNESSKGWSPIGSLIPVGERTCLTRCQCSFEYR